MLAFGVVADDGRESTAIRLARLSGEDAIDSLGGEVERRLCCGSRGLLELVLADEGELEVEVLGDPVGVVVADDVLVDPANERILA